MLNVTADKKNQAFQQLLKQVNYYDANLHVNSSLIGSDFLATTIRAWPQFFFAYVLPFPLVQAASFVIAGGLWTQRARQYHLSTVLTDEFIVSYKALRKATDKNDRTFVNENDKDIAAAIAEIERKDEARKDRIAGFLAQANSTDNVVAALQKENAEENSTRQDQWSKTWAGGFNIAFQYATAHWVLWMTLTLFLYSKDRWDFTNWHGVNEEYHEEFGNDPGNIPGVFENDTFAVLQFALPALIVVGALMYNWYYKEEKAKQDKFTKQQEHVRAEYLAYIEDEESKRKNAAAAAQVDHSRNSETSQLIAKTEKEISFFNSERWAVMLSMGTAFWSAFLVGNLLAWPITGGLNRLFDIDSKGDHGEGNEIKILTTFAIVMSGCAAHMYFKYVDMQKELRDAKMKDVGASHRWVPAQSFWEYYRANPRTAINIVLDRFSGSGGILAMRFVFMGGIGGYAWNKHDTDGMDHIKEVMPIALTAMALMIVLNLYQSYYAAQRETALKVNHDAAIVKSRPTVAA